MIATAVLGVLAGCADSESAPSVVSSTPAAASTSIAAPTPDAAAPTDAEPKQAEESAGAALTVTDIRIGRHDGFDRVEYLLDGTGTPGWNVRYIDRAVQDGSGADLDIVGRSILEVRITGSAYPFDSGAAPYSGPDPATDPTAPAITGVYRTTVYEGVTQSFIGADADRPAFSVATGSDPTRLVVDIATR